MQFSAILLAEDLRNLDMRIQERNRRVLIPVRWSTDEFPRYEQIPPDIKKFAWWLTDVSPSYRVEATPIGDFMIASGSEILQCSWLDDSPEPGAFALFEYDDMTEIEPFVSDERPGRWGPASPAFLAMVQLVKDTLRELCFPGEDRMLYSKRLVRQLLETPDPPEWALRYRRRLAKAGGAAEKPTAPASEKPTTRDHESSLALLREKIGLEGEPRPRVRRRPRHDDEPSGPSLFRTAVANQRFERITLPGLYIGRGEISDTSLSGSRLHRSTFNWSDFVNVDFSGCDLHDSDLRACNFEKCDFAKADLRRCDLRGSAFVDCDFSDAKLDGAIALKDQRNELSLSAGQRESVTWTGEYKEPAGG